MHITKCRICKSKDLKKIFSLGKQPVANNLLDSAKQNTKTYPLELLQCSHCTLIQLSYVVNKHELYDKYLYIPSVSKTHLKHFSNLAESLIQDFLLKGDLVVDIGSSDGSLLKCFEKRGMFVVGVEPATNIKKAYLNFPDYFSEKTARKIVTNYGKAKLITATNSFAHIDDLDEYLRALDILLDEDGVFFAQFPDVRNLLKENQFDTIYHEHLSYFTYEPLHYLFANSPFELFRVDESEIHGGSMRIYVRRRPKLLKGFIRGSSDIEITLNGLVNSYQESGKKVAGFGAAAKGVVLLNYCNLHLDYVVDGTSYKQGKFIPGVNTPIYPEEHLLKDKPDIILILAWNFKNEIMEKLKGRGYKFIVPIPSVEVYE